MKEAIIICMLPFKHENQKEPAKAPAFIAKMSRNKAIYSKLTILFRTVHAIIIQGQPTWDYIWMNELNSMKGTLDTGTHYSTNEHMYVEFASVIADVQKRNTWQFVKM